MWASLLLVVVVASTQAAAADVKWIDLKSKSELQQDLVLCLASVPWCGESRSFMQGFLEQLNADEFPGLQLRFINTRKPIPDEEGYSGPMVTLYRFGHAYIYNGMQLIPQNVLASLRHVVSTSPWDIPFHQLHSKEKLQEFVDSTDRAFVLVDFCGWSSSNRLIEDAQGTTDGFFINGFNSSLCSKSDQEVFDRVYERLTDDARDSFLTPYMVRFGVVTSPEVVLDLDPDLELPIGRPWLLLSRSKDVSQRWRLLEDPSGLDDFFANAGVLVEELDPKSKFLDRRPAVLLFIDRGSYHQESLEALEAVREVARAYAVLESTRETASDSSGDVLLDIPKGGNVSQDFSIEFQESVVSETQEQIILQETSAETTEVDHEVHEMIEDSSGQEAIFPVLFGYFDGAKAAEESLTGRNSSPPSLVVVIPGTLDYCVYPKGLPFDVNSLLEFLNETVLDSGTTSTHQPSRRSGTDSQPSREPVKPPFVNLQFQEIGGIPHVNLEEFPEANRNEGVLLLLTLPWCGFCKRMEVIVREVHRCFEGHFAKHGSTTCAGFAAAGFHGDNFVLPAVLQMDCTENDCDLLVPDDAKDDGYPYLLLLSSEGAPPVVYRGSPTVVGILDFVAARGNPKDDALEPSTVSVSMQKMQQNIRPTTQLTTARIARGQVLVATEKLTGSALFEGSQVLIVSAAADHVVGLIFNKQVQQDDLGDVEDELKDAIVKGAFLSKGGPLLEHPDQLYSITQVPDLQGFVQVCEEGLFVGSSAASHQVLKLIKENKAFANQFRFVTGRCGWSWPQLQQELVDGYWKLAPCSNACEVVQS